MKAKIDKGINVDQEVREKLISRGVADLSVAELLSVVIRAGFNGDSALSISEKLLKDHNNSLTELGLISIRDLRMKAGIGLNHAVIIAAAMELAKRKQLEEVVSINRINCKDDAVAYFKHMIAELPYEEFWAVYLGATNRILDKVKISQGGIASTIVDTRLIIKRALDKLATSIIIVHNHPSGNCYPSDADKAITQKLEQATVFFDIQLVDHIIITSGECFSFRAEGLL